MITQDEFKAKRAQYMANEITHAEYYDWVAAGIGLTKKHLTQNISEKEILASANEWFNDIPLSRWDRLDGIVRCHTRGLNWSLSDSVCTLKALARQIREGV